MKASLALLALAAQGALAAAPAPIREIVYNPREVIRIPVARGVPTQVLLPEGERIETDLAAGRASVCRSVGKNAAEPAQAGDFPADAWDLCGPKGGRLIVVKPVGTNPLPNRVAFMSNQHPYNLQFDVVAQADAAAQRVEIRTGASASDTAESALQRQLDAARQLLPTENQIIEQRLAMRPHVLNGNYTKAWARGSEDLIPQAVWDDGAATYLEYPGNMPVPAAFEVMPDGTEQQVNLRFDPRYDLLVVDHVTRGLRLRSGAQVVSLTNEAFDVVGRAPAKGSIAAGVERIVRDPRSGSFKEAP
jgi:type IV secretion system protein VirB9